MKSDIILKIVKFRKKERSPKTVKKSKMIWNYSQFYVEVYN